jgi:hypothetical protein
MVAVRDSFNVLLQYRPDPEVLNWKRITELRISDRSDDRPTFKAVRRKLPRIKRDREWGENKREFPRSQF